jgi:hypothetical protein
MQAGLPYSFVGKPFKCINHIQTFLLPNLEYTWNTLSILGVTRGSCVIHSEAVIRKQPSKVNAFDGLPVQAGLPYSFVGQPVKSITRQEPYPNLLLPNESSVGPMTWIVTLRGVE